jgi:hypothetical protein
MKHRWLWVSLLLTTALLGCCYMIRPKPGPVVETWVSTGQPFKVRITAFHEKIFFPGLPGMWFQVEAQSPQSSTWLEITWFRHDDPIPIPSENVRFVNSQIGFVFMVGCTRSRLMQEKPGRCGKMIRTGRVGNAATTG